MKRYHKKCWYCGSRNMEDKGDYSQCRDCRATYTDPHKVGPAEVEPAITTLQTTTGPVTVHGYKPTPYAKRKATIARNKAAPSKEKE